MSVMHRLKIANMCTSFMEPNVDRTMLHNATGATGWNRPGSSVKFTSLVSMALGAFGQYLGV